MARAAYAMLTATLVVTLLMGAQLCGGCSMPPVPPPPTPPNPGPVDPVDPPPQPEVERHPRSVFEAVEVGAQMSVLESLPRPYRTETAIGMTVMSWFLDENRASGAPMVWEVVIGPGKTVLVSQPW